MAPILVILKNNDLNVVLRYYSDVIANFFKFLVKMTFFFSKWRLRRFKPDFFSNIKWEQPYELLLDLFFVGKLLTKIFVFIQNDRRQLRFLLFALD